LTVFNIGGNKARLIAAIHYNRRKVYIGTSGGIVITTKKFGNYERGTT
jgi:hypothetical protein